MKGQSISIDWTIGFGIFIVTILTGTIFLMSFSPGTSQSAELSQKADNVFNNLEDNTSVTVWRTPIYTGKNKVGQVPQEFNYSFRQSGFKGSADIDAPSEISMADNHFSIVLNTSKEKHHLAYFDYDNENLTYQNNFDINGEVDNGVIQLEPFDGGLESLRYQGQEVLNQTAEIPGSSDVNEEVIYASTLDDDLKIFDQTGEMILDGKEKVVFNLTEFDNVYWHPGDNENVQGEGTVVEGDTKGFAFYSDDLPTITFIGDMYANVSNQETLKAEIEPDNKLRIRLDESGYSSRDRIEVYENSSIRIGIENSFEAPVEDSIDLLNQLDRETFEQELNLGGWGYQIEYGSFYKGSDIPLVETISLEYPSTKVDRFGNRTSIDSRVVIWR